REQLFGDFVNDLSDVACTMQHLQLDPRHPLWLGGFMEWTDGKPVHAAPQGHAALLAEGLGGACRGARQAADLSRYQRNREAVEGCLQFVVTLQYTDPNTQHFADW